MRRKEVNNGFFAFNLFKIIVLILILILAHIPYLGYFPAKSAIANDCVGCVPSDIWVNNPIFWAPYYFVGGGMGDFNPFGIYSYLPLERPLIFVFFTLITLFYWYFLSCLVYRLKRFIFSK